MVQKVSLEDALVALDEDALRQESVDWEWADFLRESAQGLLSGKVKGFVWERPNGILFSYLPWQD